MACPPGMEGSTSGRSPGVKPVDGANPNKNDGPPLSMLQDSVCVESLLEPLALRSIRHRNAGMNRMVVRVLFFAAGVTAVTLV